MPKNNFTDVSITCQEIKYNFQMEYDGYLDSTRNLTWNRHNIVERNFWLVLSAYRLQTPHLVPFEEERSVQKIF